MARRGLLRMRHSGSIRVLSVGEPSSPEVVALKALGDIYSPFFMEYTGTAVLKPVEDNPEVVPLPAGMPLILGALAMLGLAGRRRS